MKIELLVNGLSDKLEGKHFPPEARFSGEVSWSINYSISEEKFNLGLKPTYDQMLSYVKERKRQSSLFCFTDPTFPPRDRVLVRSGSMDKVFWRRPHHMSRSPGLFLDCSSRFEIIQGEAGDSHFLASCSAISMDSKLMDKIIPCGQSLNKSDPNYTGLIRLRFWQFGRWKEIVIDDWLPTKDGRKPVYGRSSHYDEFWLPLLEKAYAKFHGSYEAISGGGFNANSLVDLTGGMVLYHNLSKHSPPQNNDLFYTILQNLRHTSFVCCGMEEHFNPVTRRGRGVMMELSIKHAYAVVGATEIRLKDRKHQQLVRLRNPWGEGTEWKKDWSDNSSKWQNVRKRTLRKLQQQIADDQEWWMPYEEFQKYFQHVTICTLGPDLEQNGQEKWLLSSVRGKWESGVNAGGCGNDIFKYASNPQYMIILAEADTHVSSIDGKAVNQCFIQVGLMQEYRKTDENTELPMRGLGLRIYKIRRQRSGKLGRRFLGSPSTVVLQSEIYKQQREISIVGNLNLGHYVIVPSTYLPNEATSFLLRTFTDKEVKIKELH